MSKIGFATTGYKAFSSRSADRIELRCHATDEVLPCSFVEQDVISVVLALLEESRLPRSEILQVMAEQFGPES